MGLLTHRRRDITSPGCSGCFTLKSSGNFAILGFLFYAARSDRSAVATLGDPTPIVLVVHPVSLNVWLEIRSTVCLHHSLLTSIVCLMPGDVSASVPPLIDHICGGEHRSL